MLAVSLLPPGIEHTNDNILSAMTKLRYPVLVTLKKDGIRALRLAGSLLSRTLKPIPNKSIIERSLMLPGGFDMELWNPELSYDQIESIVMSREHPDSGKIQFHILDWFLEGKSYSERCYKIREWCLKNSPPLTEFIQPSPVNSPTILLRHFLLTEEQQGEGICFRTLISPYKQGRSTLKEQYLVKLARYVRQEVRIFGFIEQFENGNEDKYNDIGLMKRSSCQDKMYGKNTLGALKVETLDKGLQFTVGSGISDRLRKKIWDNRDTYFGALITIKHKPYGAKIKPRSPIFVGFRQQGY